MRLLIQHPLILLRVPKAFSPFEGLNVTILKGPSHSTKIEAYAVLQTSSSSATIIPCFA